MRRWLWPLLALWLLACLWLIAGASADIALLRLPDPDDNLRLLQVRDWLGGQAWFDLHQHRLAPAGGADIHWSRLVDLPLAAAMLALRPFIGAMAAEQVAVVLVPLLTLLAAMLLVAQIARRLIAPQAGPFAAAILLTAGPAVGMMSPLRIDHHGWQIVLLLAMLLGLVVRGRAAGGVIAGLAIAGSLTIGVEMLPYLALGLTLAAFGWIMDPEEAPRLKGLAVSLGVGILLALSIFVAPEMRVSLGCDALSAAYARPLLLGSALLLVATWLPLPGRMARLAAAAVAGTAAAALLLSASPLCVTDPYHAIDPEARRLWLDMVAEALPLYRQGANVALAVLVLPLIGLGGAIVMMRRSRDDAEVVRGWLLLAAVSAFSLLLAAVQTRAAVTAQAVAAPGAGALLYFGWLRVRSHGAMLVRVFGTVLLFLAVSGLLPRLAINAAFAGRSGLADQQLDRINALCLDPRSMTALDRLPPAILFADVDLTAPIIAHTHHRALAGPFHRNGRVIADVMRAWAGKPEDGLATARRYGADYVVACGANSEAQAYLKRAPHGLYASLLQGRPPGWLTPVPLGRTPWRAWRVRK
jgi:hypothetical protein